MTLDAALVTPLTAPLRKVPTGIIGFDDITLGGLPAGRPSLICGAAGCGKTLFGMTFLVHGATACDEPGTCCRAGRASAAGISRAKARPKDSTAFMGRLDLRSNAVNVLRGKGRI